MSDDAPAFTHLDAGTDEAVWRAAGVDALPELAPRDWSPDDLLVVAVAHPDDETLGAAALIRSALRGGARVRILVATAGEASHPDSPTHTPADLVRLRRAEMDHAVAALADGLPDALSWAPLGLPDGDVAGDPDAVRAAVAGELDAHAASAPDGTAVLASHDPGDGHTDHEAVGAVVAALAAERHLPLYAFPIWFWHWGEPAALPARRYRRLPLAAGDAEARRAALDAHASQVRPLSDAPGDEAILTDRMLSHVLDRTAETHRYSGPDDADAARASAVFNRLYRDHEDPWHYLTSPYEARKRELTLASLPRRRYGTVVEAGASIGVLTARLAERAERVVGLEASDLAVRRAAGRLAELPHAEVRHAVLPADWPAELAGPDAVDLVVASEIGYFLQPEELDALVDAAHAALGPGGELLLCHWRHPISGWPLDGDEVHARVAADPRWRLLSEHVEEDFRIAVHAPACRATHAVVVVPAKDEAASLPASLTALGAALDHWEAHHAHGSTAAVVVVPAGDGPTLEAARRARVADGRIHVLALPEQGAGDDGAHHDDGTRLEGGTRLGGGVGRARAEGSRAARALFEDVPADRLWLAATDADTAVPADWLVAGAVLAARRRSDGEALVLGTVDVDGASADGDAGVAATGADADLVAAWRADYTHAEDHPHVHGANLQLPWSLYERAGGFPAVPEHEDVALAEAVRALGADRVVATDRTRVSTSGRLHGRTPGGFAGYLRELAAGGEGAAVGPAAGDRAGTGPHERS